MLRPFLLLFLVRPEGHDEPGLRVRARIRGALIKRGAGSLTLSGDNRFDGFTLYEGALSLTGHNAYDVGFDGIVEGGALSLSGSLQGNALRVNAGQATVTAEGKLQGADLFVSTQSEDARAASVSFNGLQTGGGATWVGPMGRLGGTGTLGETRVAGTIAPGNSIGTLTVNGDYWQLVGSRFEVELAPPDQRDVLQVKGKAMLEGGTVVALRGPGVYGLGERYAFLSAENGVSGRFLALDTTDITPFLKLKLAYAPTLVALDVSRGMAFANLAATHNQRTTAGSIDGLRDSNDLVRTLVQLFPDKAMPAIDLLSGDTHASVQSALVDSSRHVRNAALDRSRNMNDPFAGQYDDSERFGAWLELQGTGGQIHTDGNAAGVEYSGGNTLVGADYQFDSGLRLGVLGGIGNIDLKVPDRLNARADLRSRQAGVYAGQGWGGFGWRAGITWGNHDADLRQKIEYTGFSDVTQAKYDVETLQGFVELGYRFGNPRWGLEPYAQFAQVRVESDAFNESGAAAALSGQTRDVNADLTTAGIRFDANFKSKDQAHTWLSLRGGLGYRKTGGELVPWTEMAFTIGDRFMVHGAPVASDATLLDLGVAARLSTNSLLELGYHGQYADEAREHGASLRWSLQF
ncbi:autotransporter outer membrane beta-barrel domain-containing protein [Luteimonas sp. RIT-PG2_3]